MTLATLRGLMARRARAALTALAVVLGVAMIAGSLILTDSVERAFVRIFDGTYANTDLVVRAAPVVDDSVAGSPTVPADLLARVRAVPGVGEAAGNLVDWSGTGNTARILDRDGQVIAGNNPTFGFGVDPRHPRFAPMTLADGRWASGPDQVVIDATVASGNDYAVGDRVRIAGDGPARPYTVSGIARFGDVDSLGGATIALFDVPTARAVLGKSGFDAIQVAAAPGVDPSALAARIAPLLPTGAAVATGAEQAAADRKGIDEMLSFIRVFLLAFGGIALLVGAFVIVNTLSITVAQRTRELATLRTLGATRRQVRRSVLLESLVIGLVASAAGLVTGIGLASGMTAAFRAIGAELPQGDAVISGTTVAVAMIAGTLATVVAGLLPAVRATRVAPIAAVREGAAGSGDGRRRGAAGLVVRPVAAIVGWPVARTGAAGRLARANAVRNPGRTAATAAALMIGLTLVTAVAVLGTGLSSTARGDVLDQVRATQVVTSSTGWDPLPVAAGRDAARALPGATVSPVRGDQARVAAGADRTTSPVNGVDPATIGAMVRFEWTAGGPGALARLAGDGVIVTARFADDHGLRVGAPLTITTPSGTRLTRTVAGIHDAPRLMPVLDSVVIGRDAFDRAFPRPADRFLLVSGAEHAALERALAAHPDATVHTRDGFADQRISDLAMIVNMLYVLLALSVVVSVLGMVNTLVLSVHERTRELGMLRAVGMTRRQARRMVRGESVITALIGAALGLPAGIGVAALATDMMSGWDVRMDVPVVPLVLFAVVAIAVGVLAAVAPARRAARLDVLRALQYE